MVFDNDFESVFQNFEENSGLNVGYDKQNVKTVVYPSQAEKWSKNELFDHHNFDCEKVHNLGTKKDQIKRYESEQKVENENFEKSICDKNAKIVVYPSQIKFSWNNLAKEVLLSGSFDKWEQKIKLNKIKDNMHEISLSLTSGIYQFKFIVDGEWHFDPNLETTSDGCGGLNNVITVNKCYGVTGASHQNISEGDEEHFGEPFNQGRLGESGEQTFVKGRPPEFCSIQKSDHCKEPSSFVQKKMSRRGQNIARTLKMFFQKQEIPKTLSVMLQY